MKRLFAIAVFLGIIVAPAYALAAPVKNTLEVSGWLPYWRAETGTADTVDNLNYLTTIHPFSLTVDEHGDLVDRMDIESDPWPEFLEEAKDKKVRVIPTIMWNDGEAIHRVLSDEDDRDDLVDDIADLVREEGWDGIDIDFESKLAETNEYFSDFLRELYNAMGNKWVYCTIESRTPLESRYDSIPANIEYANDYEQINKYCDRVQVMAYDQGGIDLKLGRTAAGPYRPVADTRWTEKVMREAMKTIDKNKLVIGIPTYGYEYQVEPLSASTYAYERLWAFNPQYAVDAAAKLGLTPTRSVSGELQLLYLPQMLQGDEPANDTQVSNLGVPATALSNTATAPALRTVFNMMIWGDSVSVKQKIDLAHKLGVRGIAIFKFDGGQDPNIWSILAGR